MRARRNTCTPIKHKIKITINQTIPKREDANSVYIRKVYAFFIVINCVKMELKERLCRIIRQAYVKIPVYKHIPFSRRVK